MREEMDNDIIDYGQYISAGVNDKKERIIICHTSREVGEYLTSLKFRFNGKSTKIPHFVITREGDVLRLLKDNEFSFFIKDDNINETSIIIVLENLGWLTKEPLNDYYINWIGNIYKGKIFEKKWRDNFFWQPYTEEQIKSCAELCKKMIEKFKINKKCIGHNTKVEGAEKFKGIISRSNLSLDNTDLSPAFNFEIFIKQIENE